MRQLLCFRCDTTALLTLIAHPQPRPQVATMTVGSMSTVLRMEKVCKVGTDWFGNGKKKERPSGVDSNHLFV